MLTVMHHLMGAAEIGDRLGVSRQRVQQIVARPDFPKPDHELRMGKVWTTESVEAWIRTHRPELAAHSDAEAAPVAEAPRPPPGRRLGPTKKVRKSRDPEPG